MRESKNSVRLIYMRYDQVKEDIKTITLKTLYFKTATDALNFYKESGSIYRLISLGVWNGEYYEEVL